MIKKIVMILFGIVYPLWAVSIIQPIDATVIPVDNNTTPMDTLQYPIDTLLYPMAATVYPVQSTKYYTTTSYYVAYDSHDLRQYALVMPSAGRIYTHVAGDIKNLYRVDSAFSTFPSYDNGQLCFSTLKRGTDSGHGVSTMAGKCYEVKFFYTQKERTDNGTAFILYYRPADRVYEGLAGQAETFKVVKEGDNIYNDRSITEDDYSHFRFDIENGHIQIKKIQNN